MSPRGAPVPLVPSEDASASPAHAPGRERPPRGRTLGQVRHESELLQLSARITIERLNMNKCCRFIYNASFYLWNVSEWSKDTQRLLETLVSQERQPRPQKISKSYLVLLRPLLKCPQKMVRCRVRTFMQWPTFLV